WPEDGERGGHVLQFTPLLWAGCSRSGRFPQISALSLGHRLERRWLPPEDLLACPLEDADEPPPLLLVLEAALRMNPSQGTVEPALQARHRRRIRSRRTTWHVQPDRRGMDEGSDGSGGIAARASIPSPAARGQPTSL